MAPWPVVILALDGGDGIPKASLLGRPVAQTSCGLEWESLPHLVIRRAMQDDFWHQSGLHMHTQTHTRKHTHTHCLSHIHAHRQQVHVWTHTQNMHAHTCIHENGKIMKLSIICFWLSEAELKQPRLVLEPWPSYLSLMSARITGTCHLTHVALIPSPVTYFSS